MGHKMVADVMTRDVVTVRADTPFREIVAILAAHGVSGAPVLDPQRRVLGMVSEADLLGRQARAGGVAGAAIWHLLRRKAFARSGAAHTAAELMSTPAVTVPADARLAAAAATLARYDVKRVPVVDPEGVLVGIVSRKDLLSVYLRTDAELAAQVGADVLENVVWVALPKVSIEAVGGVVTLRGKVKRQSMIEVMLALTAAVDGVVDVHNELVAEIDDVSGPSARALGATHVSAER